MGWFHDDDKKSDKKTLAVILSATRRLEKGQEVLMALVDDIKVKLDSMATSIDGIEVDQAALVAKVQELSDIIAGGGVVTQDQLTEVLEQATAIDERLKAIDVKLP